MQNFGSNVLGFWKFSFQHSTSTIGTRLVVESGFHQIFAVQSGILAIGIRNTAQGIWNQTKEWNLEKKFQLLKIRNPVPGILHPRHGIQNPRLCWIPLHWATSY